MSDSRSPLLRREDAESKGADVSHGSQLHLVRQFFHIFLLLIRFKARRLIFMIGVILLLQYNLFTSLLRKHETERKSRSVESGLTFYGTSDFVSSGHKVLADRNAFPAEVKAASSIMADRGSGAGWLKDCSTESHCKDAFISARDSVMGYMRYSNTETSPAVLECFSASSLNQICAFLYQLMVQSSYKTSVARSVFKDVQFFALILASESASKQEQRPKNETQAISNSICSSWINKQTSTFMLLIPLTLITGGVAFYWLISTVSFIRVFKTGGFYQQLVRNGFSVSAYWTAIWFTTVAECLLFSCVFTLSHALPCPDVFPSENTAKIFTMMGLYFLSLACLTILMELLISSIIAISMLMVAATFALFMALMSDEEISKKHPFILAVLPPLNVKKYIANYMHSTSGALDDSSSAGKNPENYQSMLYSNAATALILVAMVTYLDFLLRCGNGLYLPPTYPFSCSFWRQRTGPSEDTRKEVDKGQTELHIETVTGLSPSIVVDTVTKTYKECWAAGHKVLHELSCKIYRNQITALIGHNGAGKSTLIKILSGDERPDCGAAYISGIKVTDPLQRMMLRGRVNVCPQFDALCAAMTVIECIRITVESRRVRGESEVERARMMLRRLGLGDKENLKSTDLSGGQKRKVSTILALLGDPDVVFLDEPTSGLDPVSRRQLWQLLQEEKVGRCIVLCTQFMDEADILADRKIFLCGGRIVCAGSSMFLKRAFGCSFTLNVSLKTESDAKQLLPRMQNVRLKNLSKTELQLEVTAAKPEALVEAVQLLEDSEDVEAFGLSQANLDDIFMRLSGVSSDEVIQAFHAGNLSAFLEKAENVPVLARSTAELSQPLDQNQRVSPSGFRQFSALLRTNVKKCIRTTSSIWTRIVIPALLMVSMATYLKVTGDKDTVTKLNATSFIMQPDKSEINRKMCSFALRMPIYLDNFPHLLWSAVYVRDQSNATNVNDGSESQAATFTEMCQSLNLPTRNSTFGPFVISKPRSVSFEDFMKMQSTRDSLRIGCGVQDDFCPYSRCKVCVIFYASSWMRTEPNSNRKISIGVFTSDSKHVEDTDVYRKAFIKLSQLFSDDELSNAPTVSYIKLQNDFFFVEAKLVLFIMVFSLFPVSYLNDPIKDICTGVRSHLVAMGMTHVAYWVNIFFLHWVQYIFCSAVLVGILCIVEQFRNPYFFLLTFLPIVFFGTASNQLTLYTIAAITRTPNTVVLLLCNIAAIVLPLVMMSLASKNTDISAIILLLPPMAPMALVHFSREQVAFRQEYYNASTVSDTPGLLENCWDHKFVLLSFAIMPIHIAVMCGIIAMAEHSTAIWAWLRRSAPAKESGELVSSVDQGPQREQERLLQSPQNSENVLEVRQLSMTYANGVHAVRGVTFGVRAGEIFGLLGANGAGKSTSMSVVVGEVAATGGSVQVRNRDGVWVSGRCGASMGVIGYCPQHNPLLDNITVAEHLALYADIRGVPSTVTGRQATALLQSLGLQPNRDKLARQLSGGNKRRLCLAIALLGDPTLVVIDEASTGVDPENKRFIWAAIRGMLHSQRSVMVTTHSMEEVEALCNRVGIMNNGSLVAFGTVQQLRSLHGDAYTLDVLLLQGAADSVQRRKSAIKSAVSAQFKGAAVPRRAGSEHAVLHSKESREQLVECAEMAECQSQ